MTTLADGAVLVFQAALVLVVLEALRRRNRSATVNGLVALGAALLPAVVRAALRAGPGVHLSYGPELPLWIAIAGLVHAVGMLGLYDTIWWWDHLAHTVSSALVTALVYAAVLVVAPASPVGRLSTAGVVGVTLGFVLVLTVLWELIEELARHLAERYDIGPLLVVYGPYDWAFDLAFNLVGAGLVLLLDVRLFVPLFEPFPGGTARLLLGIGGFGVVAGVVLALFLSRASDEWP